MNGRSVSKIFIFGGLLLIAAALCLTLYNIREQAQAARAAMDALEQLEERISLPEKSKEQDEYTPELLGKEPLSESEIPEYVRNPNMQMPEVDIDGQTYIGIISIPALELCLPVIGEWSYPRLKMAPCRYQGSAYSEDLMIMAHNYVSHFGTLNDLQSGDEIYFEDTEGNIFGYSVAEKETLNGTAMDELVAGDWALTLFTCTTDGKSRITVRCRKADGE